MMNKIEVYDDNKALAGALQKAMGDVTPNAIYVNLFATSGISPKIYGIVKNNPDKKVILYDIRPVQELWLEPDFKKIMSNPNTRFVPIPINLREVLEKYLKKDIANPALEATAYLGAEQNIVGRIRHDAHYDKAGSAERARQALGMQGTDDEIMKMLENYKDGDSIGRNNVSGNFFGGVFCDIEGTLKHGSAINEDLVKELDKYSRTKPVNIWTGGDIKEMISFLRQHKIEYPILSKGWFNGASVEIAIDDLDESEFRNRYSIKSNVYKQV